MKDFSKGVRDFLYLPQYNSMFVALSDMNLITRMDSYFTNVSIHPSLLNIILSLFLDHASMGEEEGKASELCFDRGSCVYGGSPSTLQDTRCQPITTWRHRTKVAILCQLGQNLCLLDKYHALV